MSSQLEIVDKCVVCERVVDINDCPEHGNLLFCFPCWEKVIKNVPPPLRGKTLRTRFNEAVDKVMEEHMYLILEESIRE